MNAQSETAQLIAKYNDRFQPHEYRQVFYPPVSGQGRVDALFAEGYFESAKLLLNGLTTGQLRPGIEGVAAVFLSRHYLELALKYVLFHSRWLNDEDNNATSVEPVGRDLGHDLNKLWATLTAELGAKRSVVPTGLDLDFVGSFVSEFHANDPGNWRFRYSGKQLPVVHSSDQDLGIDFDSLLYNLQIAHDVLDTLDGRLVDTYGANEEWQQEQNSW